jgi:hypothetical protein
MANVKREGKGKTLIMLLSLTLVAALLAGTGLAYAQEAEGTGGGGAAQTNPPPPSVREKTDTIADNRIEVLGLRLQCAQTSDRIRHSIQAMRDAGTKPDEEARAAIKEARDAIRAGRETLRGTVSEIEAEREAARADHESKDWPALEEHLDHIIALQETRIATLEDILEQLSIILGWLG